MNRFSRTFQGGLAAFAFIAAAFLATANASADKLVMKDGRVLVGKVQRNEGGVIIFVRKVDGKDVMEYLSADDVKTITIEDATPVKTPEAPKTSEPAATKPDAPKVEAGKTESPDAKKADAKKKGVSDRQLTGRPARIAVLNFGSPARNQGADGDMVGVNISAKAFADVIPILEKNQVDIVVIRINSGGGYTLEMGRFTELFDQVYKKKFRTVAWVESAISAAAMSPWVIEEFYMMTNGNIGGCTEWSGGLVATKGVNLEVRLQQMEASSRLAGRDPKIMRAMQIQEPLSCNIEENGTVTWFQDTTGQILVNRGNEILTLNSEMAVKTKFAKGIADTKEELAKAMGLTEYEFVAADATKFIDRFSEDATRFEETFRETVRKYLLQVNIAESVPREQRASEVGRAQKLLSEMERMVGLNPNFEFHFGNMVGAMLDRDFFETQRDRLRKLLK